jgi:hypothetical protein
LLALGLTACNDRAPSPVSNTISIQSTNDGSEGAIVLEFPSDRYPKTAEHIKEAIEHGETDICTIDRDGATENRKESLKGIPTKKGYDRDEFPMAMCAEGGTGADVEYVPYSDNRGSGSWVGNHFSEYPDGTKIRIVVK